MSYSIMTPFETEEERDKMMRFLNLYYKIANEIFDFLGNVQYVSNPITDPSYYDEKEPFVIGFDYNASGLERYYAFQICYWMAEMAGKEKEFQAPHGKIKYVTYDGCEYIGLAKEVSSYDVSDADEYAWSTIVVDEIGFKKLNKRVEPFIDLPKYEKALHEEIKRLTSLWKEFEVKYGEREKVGED